MGARHHARPRHGVRRSVSEQPSRVLLGISCCVSNGSFSRKHCLSRAYCNLCTEPRSTELCRIDPECSSPPHTSSAICNNQPSPRARSSSRRSRRPLHAREASSGASWERSAMRLPFRAPMLGRGKGERGAHTPARPARVFLSRKTFEIGNESAKS